MIRRRPIQPQTRRKARRRRSVDDQAILTVSTSTSDTSEKREEGADAADLDGVKTRPGRVIGPVHGLCG